MIGRYLNLSYAWTRHGQRDGLPLHGDTHHYSTKADMSNCQHSRSKTSEEKKWGINRLSRLWWSHVTCGCTVSIHDVWLWYLEMDSVQLDSQLKPIEHDTDESPHIR